MEDGSAPGNERPTKKRRIPKACAACRGKKLACDEERPCSRCSKAGIECMYFKRPKDPQLERIEKIQAEVERLHHRLDATEFHASPHTQRSPSIGQSIDHSRTDVDANAAGALQGGQHLTQPRPEHVIADGYVSTNGHSSSGKTIGFQLRQSSNTDIVSSGYVLETDARLWFSTFFDGCDRFVPVFDPALDTFDSVRRRSNTLFDVILIFGARAIHGVLSRPHQRLYGLLREHTSDLVLRLSGRTRQPVSIEDIQALLVIASYSDSGGVLCDVALKASLEVGLPNQLDSIFSAIANHAIQTTPINPSWFVAARIWYYLYVLDMILSIDGGKPTSISQLSSPRRVRSLLNHPQRTTLDIRLFAQVELNAIRANAHSAIASNTNNIPFSLPDTETVQGAILDLDLWLSEWQEIVHRHTPQNPETPILTLNLQIQHAWALLTLHLRALTASGIENIALMTAPQRATALAAKSAAETHLRLLLTNLAPGTSSPSRPYIANCRYAMEFVWAKNAFAILIVLRLGILLEDTSTHLLARLAEAKDFLRELDGIGTGANVSYTRILAQTVGKCEDAVMARVQEQGEGRGREEGEREAEFERFVPKEFMFEWDFPGLHLCYIPLDWQDLFLDFGGTSG